MPFARGFGLWELVIILVVIMIIFGVGRLPEVGGALGNAVKEFRKSQSDKVGATTDSVIEEKEKSST